MVHEFEAELPGLINLVVDHLVVDYVKILTFSHDKKGRNGKKGFCKGCIEVAVSMDSRYIDESGSMGIFM